MPTSFHWNGRIFRKEEMLNLYILDFLQIMPQRLHFGPYHLHIKRNLRGNQTEVSLCYRNTVYQTLIIIGQ